MKTITASEFKAKCLRIIDEVAETGESVLVTKNGKPIAELVTAKQRPKGIFGSMRGTGHLTEDIDLIDFSDEWEALRDDDSP